MAIVRMTAENAKSAARIDRAKVAATQEEDIRRHMVEDGEKADMSAASAKVVWPAAAVRAKTGLSQDKFARSLGLSPKTIRNWEQGRTIPDPAAKALLRLVADDPERVFKVLASA